MPADKPVADEGTRCACPVRCKFCGARLKHDEHGPYCNTTNCQWSLNQGNPPSCVGAPAPAARPGAEERCAKCGMPRVTVGHGSLGAIPPAGHAFVASAPAAKPGAERCACGHPEASHWKGKCALCGCPVRSVCECGELPGHPRHDKDTGDHAYFAPSPATREHAAEGEWWQHFNDRVRGRVEGEYGPFTNADWQAACAAEREIAALRARISGLERVIEEAPHDWACHTQTAPVSGDCDCWKSEAKVSG